MNENKLKNALLEYQEAHKKLLEVWQQNDHTSDSLTEFYPFDMCFDDLYSKVKIWVNHSINIK